MRESFLIASGLQHMAGHDAKRLESEGHLDSAILALESVDFLDRVIIRIKESETANI